MSGANITATLYDGDFCLSFDCGEITTCKYALCETMPPDGDQKCYFREYGACRNGAAQLAALTALRDRLTRELRQIAEEATDGE